MSPPVNGIVTGVGAPVSRTEDVEESSKEVAEVVSEVNESTLATIETSADLDGPSVDDDEELEPALMSPTLEKSVDIDRLEEVALDDSFKAE